MATLVPTPLADAVLRAITTAEQVSALIPIGSETDIDTAEDEAWTAKHNMLAAFQDMGINPMLIRRLGAVL